MDVPGQQSSYHAKRQLREKEWQLSIMKTSTDGLDYWQKSSPIGTLDLLPTLQKHYANAWASNKIYPPPFTLKQMAYPKGRING